MPVTWCLANPKIGEREVMAALLQRGHRLVRAGQVILADMLRRQQAQPVDIRLGR
jgi:hypothetical protein